MSTDSYWLGPQGNADGVAGKDDDVDRDRPPPPSHAGARSRATPDRRPSRRSAPPRRRRKARRVHRVVHHLDIWSLAKMASIFVLCAYVVGIISGFLLWRAAARVGTIDGIEGFMEDTGGYDSFVLDGSVVFSSTLLVGMILGVLSICLIVLMGILFNLISDLTGGIRMTVIDEDLIVTPARRGRPAPPQAADGAFQPRLDHGASQPRFQPEPTQAEPTQAEPTQAEPVQPARVQPAPVEAEPSTADTSTARPADPPPVPVDAEPSNVPTGPAPADAERTRPEPPADWTAEPPSPDVAATSPSPRSKFEIDFG